MDSQNELKKRITAVHTVGTQVDACEDKFLVAVLNKPFHLVYDLLPFPASHTPPHIGDNTVAAELIASVLHFQVSSGVLPCGGELQFLILHRFF